ncbi:MAG: hypothetical protein KBD63_04520 [Bacteriovoracaceae bacterium]|nr:hypothetical protein [Bacteriovoracaceae bacterium]
MYRNNAYNEDLAKEFKNPKFAREYLMNLIEDADEPMTVEEALLFMIPRMGVAEFCHMTGKGKADVDKFLRGDRRPKPETLNEYLKPFGLKIKMILEKVA